MSTKNVSDLNYALGHANHFIESFNRDADKLAHLIHDENEEVQERLAYALVEYREVLAKLIAEECEITHIDIAIIG